MTVGGIFAGNNYSIKPKVYVFLNLEYQNGFICSNR